MDKREQEYGAHLSELLERYASESPVPATEQLVEGGLARGRRSRARRRTLWTT
ncbi:hypothetical protein G3I76_48245, partial [Streptomyces sp. SID11233]|nr:hypothetical protein [Streptomyces sp. SID11233]